MHKIAGNETNNNDSDNDSSQQTCENVGKTNENITTNNNDIDSSKTPSGPQDNENKKSGAVSPPPSTKTYLFNSPNITLLLCAIGLLVAYLTWGFMQEVYILYIFTFM